MHTVTGAVFILLIGFPGTGKHTIARAIRRRSDASPVDNHSITNDLRAVAGRAILGLARS